MSDVCMFCAPHKHRYGGTNRACRTMFTDMGMEFDFIDFTEISNIERHIKSNTKLIFSETPANPTLTLTDISAVSALARSRGVPHVVDSTFATPVITRPIDHGADLVIQSTTKFYDGHNITVGGAVACATTELHEQIKHMQNVHGSIMSPQNAFYTLQVREPPSLPPCTPARRRPCRVHAYVLRFDCLRARARRRPRPWASESCSRAPRP